MNKYEAIKTDMTVALKNNNKLLRLTLADIIATIDKASMSGKTRAEITDEFVNDVLIKYKKTVQEMIDTCPDDEKYAGRKAEYKAKLAIVANYAPRVLDDPFEIETLILNFCCDNDIVLTNANRGAIMKNVMPYVKQCNCDMKVAQEVLKKIIV